MTNTNTSTNTNLDAMQSAQGMGGAAGGMRSAAPARPAAAGPPRQTSTAVLANAREVRSHATTTSGALLLLAAPQSIQRDCSPLGRVEAKVVRAPDHGTVSVAPGAAFPRFVPGDPAFGCNGRKLPATVISYRSEPGYTGEDRGEVQVFFPDGRAPVLVFDISVR